MSSRQALKDVGRGADWDGLSTSGPTLIKRGKFRSQRSKGQRVCTPVSTDGRALVRNYDRNKNYLDVHIQISLSCRCNNCIDECTKRSEKSVPVLHYALCKAKKNAHSLGRSGREINTRQWKREGKNNAAGTKKLLFFFDKNNNCLIYFILIYQSGES